MLDRMISSDMIKNKAKRMASLVAIGFLISLLASCAFPPKPVPTPAKPFVSDGCSLWPDWDYGSCCVDHDQDYWLGGTPAERRSSDLRLKQCVADKGHAIMPIVMYIGIRIGGHGWLPTPFRWGFGHHWPRGYFSE